MAIQTIVLDLGNLFLRWAPYETLSEIFPDEDPHSVWKKYRPAWRDLNRGKMPIEEATTLFEQITGLPAAGFRRFCDRVMGDAILLEDMDVLQARLKEKRLPMYYLSDNLHEAIAYYKEHYPFMQRFDGGISSSDVGHLKPNAEIYEALLVRYNLDPGSCVFFDDVDINVEGARKAGMQAFLYTDAAACEEDLKRIGVL